MGKVKTDDEIQAMREGGAMLATVLDVLEKRIAPGVTGKELAHAAAVELKALGGLPAFKGVPGPPGIQAFPDIICISISEEVQHGIPSDRALREGDVVNLDFGVLYKGLITDAGRTYPVGNISADAQRLLTGTKEALKAGLGQVRTGARIRDISAAIEDVLESYDLGIVLELVGHGVGHALHEDPEIPNYRTNGGNYRLKKHETIAIEPIATLGSGRIIFADDGWTILSADHTLSAQFENTVKVEDEGYEILTIS